MERRAGQTERLPMLDGLRGVAGDFRDVLVCRVAFRHTVPRFGGNGSGRPLARSRWRRSTQSAAQATSGAGRCVFSPPVERGPVAR